MGTDCYSNGVSGPTARIRRKGRASNTPAQLETRANLTKATKTYKALGESAILAWKVYSKSVVKRNVVNGRAYSPTALNVYTALATRLLLIDPSNAMPSLPPTSDYAGDAISLNAIPGVGSVTFVASGPTSAHTVVELLLQPLASKNRTPSPKAYRNQGYATFAAGSLSAEISVPASSYAAGYRFVNAQTGQATALVALGVLTVGLSVEDGGQAGASASRSKAKRAA